MQLTCRRVYKNYSDPEYWHNGNFCRTALESFESLLKSEIKTVNKYGDKPVVENYTLTGKNEAEIKMIEEDRSGIKPSWKSVFLSNFKERLSEWEADQATVFNNPIYLISKK